MSHPMPAFGERTEKVPDRGQVSGGLSRTEMAEKHGRGYEVRGRAAMPGE